jgi:hypothetical protein
MAQVGSYLGPGVLSPGAGTIGQRSGSDVDLRLYADVVGIYDNGIQPFEVNSKGDLVTLNGLYGVQIDYGLYGTHSWAHSVLGVDVAGNVFDYVNATNYDGTNDNLTLGWTYQKSRRLVFDLRQVAGTSTLGYGAPGFYGVSAPETLVNQPTSLLFDSRIYYLQSTANMTYILTPRTSFTVGGDGLIVRRQASGLAGTNGWNARGVLQHRLSRSQTVGVQYERLHFNFPPAFGRSDTNVGEGFFATGLGKRWTFNVHAGVFQSAVVGLQQVELNPVIAALLGTTFGTEKFFANRIYPSGQATLAAHLKNSVLSLNYAEMVVPGNGVYLTSRQDSGFVDYSYTAIHKWNFGVRGGYYRLNSVGQNLQTYDEGTGGAGFTYSLSHSFHVVGRYDYRYQDINAVSYRRNGSRATLGLAFSPGDLPLSLW